jgi:meiotic recombination protein REC8, fungi type
VIQDVEIGREAPEALPEDHSSQMPWDVYSASRLGSARPFGSAAAGMTSSVGGPVGGFELGPPSILSRRGSRLTTASPLHGRGPPLPLSQRISIISTPEREGLPSGAAFEGDIDMFGGELPPLGDESEEFHLYGPAAAVDTQTAAQSQWLAAALDSESRNFLDFLDAQIQAQPLTAEEEEEELPGGERQQRTATFEGLLPPGEHSRVVAAQAFLHVLTLASKNLITVMQEEGFGDIELGIAVEA